MFLPYENRHQQRWWRRGNRVALYRRNELRKHSVGISKVMVTSWPSGSACPILVFHRGWRP